MPFSLFSPHSILAAVPSRPVPGSVSQSRICAASARVPVQIGLLAPMPGCAARRLKAWRGVGKQRRSQRGPCPSGPPRGRSHGRPADPRPAQPSPALAATLIQTPGRRRRDTKSRGRDKRGGSRLRSRRSRGGRARLGSAAPSPSPRGRCGLTYREEAGVGGEGELEAVVAQQRVPAHGWRRVPGAALARWLAAAPLAHFRPAAKRKQLKGQERRRAGRRSPRRLCRLRSPVAPPPPLERPRRAARGRRGARGSEPQPRAHGRSGRGLWCASGGCPLAPARPSPPRRSRGSNATSAVGTQEQADKGMGRGFPPPKKKNHEHLLTA